jgi:hypothetical protein
MPATAIDPSTLPAPESISHTKIREAAEVFAKASKDLNDRKRDVVQLEHELPNAELADAQADEAARAAGKPKLTKRTHTEKHQKAIADARHELRVAQLAIERRRTELNDALRQYGSAWLADTEKLVAALDTAWDNAIAELSKLHGEHQRAVSLARTIGSDHLGVSRSTLDRRQLDGLEIPSGAATTYGIHAEDLIAALAELGKAKSEPEPATSSKPMRFSSPNESSGAVREEIEERRRFAQAVNAPGCHNIPRTEGERRRQELERQAAAA